MRCAVRGARVRLGGVQALDGVTVEVPEGRVTAVAGGDGAGKSTLLRVMVGQVALDSGSVAAPDAARIGYLPARAGSWAELTVQENVDFVGAAYGLRGEELSRRGADLLERADLAQARDRLAGQLSGGMRRKLGFCLAMLHRPDLLVLDEPSTGVDPVSRVDLWRLVSEAAAHGAAVLMSTTYLDEAERCASLVVLNAGEVLVAGAPDEVVSSFRGTVTVTPEPSRPDLAWRRGRGFREWWPPGQPPSSGEPVVPDLEDVVIATTIARHAGSVPS